MNECMNERMNLKFTNIISEKSSKQTKRKRNPSLTYCTYDRALAPVLSSSPTSSRGLGRP